MMWECRECRTSISAEAEVCPRCGIRFKPPPEPPAPGAWGRQMEIASGVFLGMLAWTVFAAVMGMLLAGVIVSRLSTALQQPTPFTP